jgi:hypothetical protein
MSVDFHISLLALHQVVMVFVFTMCSMAVACEVLADHDLAQNSKGGGS